MDLKDVFGPLTRKINIMTKVIRSYDFNPLETDLFVDLPCWTTFLGVDVSPYRDRFTLFALVEKDYSLDAYLKLVTYKIILKQTFEEIDERQQFYIGSYRNIGLHKVHVFYEVHPQAPMVINDNTEESIDE